MDIYRARIKSNGSIDNLKSRIVVRGDLADKGTIGDTWHPTEPMRSLKYFLEDYSNNKAKLHQLNFFGAFLKANVKHRVLMKLNSIYGEYFPEHAKYF